MDRTRQRGIECEDHLTTALQGNAGRAAWFDSNTLGPACLSAIVRRLPAFMKSHSPVLLIAACCILSGCDRPAASSGQHAQRYQQQMDDYEKGMKRADENLAHMERQTQKADELQARLDEENKRFDKILDKWEEQAKRMDALLGQMEKEHGLKK